MAALPLPHASAEFSALWTTFRTGPKQVGKPLTAFELMLTKLAKYPEAFAVVMLERAIQGDWSGVENAGTAKAFAEWQAEQASRPKSASPPLAPPLVDPDALFGYTQSAADGLAQARQGPEYQHYLAQVAQEQAAQLALADPDLQHAA